MGPTDFRLSRPALVCRSNFYCSVQNVYTICQPVWAQLCNHSKRGDYTCSPMESNLLACYSRVDHPGWISVKTEEVAIILCSVSPVSWEPLHHSRCIQPGQDFRHRGPCCLALQPTSSSTRFPLTSPTKQVRRLHSCTTVRFSYMRYIFEKSFYKAQLWELEYVLSVKLHWAFLLGVICWLVLTVNFTVLVGFCQPGTNLDISRKRLS